MEKVHDKRIFIRFTIGLAPTAASYHGHTMSRHYSFVILLRNAVSLAKRLTLVAAPVQILYTLLAKAGM